MGQRQRPCLIIGEDQFQILPPEPQTIKFYMPLTAQLYAYDDWGDLEEYGNDLDGRELRDYQSCIHEATAGKPDA